MCAETWDNRNIFWTGRNLRIFYNNKRVCWIRCGGVTLSIKELPIAVFFYRLKSWTPSSYRETTDKDTDMMYDSLLYLNDTISSTSDVFKYRLLFYFTRTKARIKYLKILDGVHILYTLLRVWWLATVPQFGYMRSNNCF